MSARARARAVSPPEGETNTQSVSQVAGLQRGRNAARPLRQPTHLSAALRCKDLVHRNVSQPAPQVLRGVGHAGDARAHGAQPADCVANQGRGERQRVLLIEPPPLGVPQAGVDELKGSRRVDAQRRAVRWLKLSNRRFLKHAKVEQAQAAPVRPLALVKQAVGAAVHWIGAVGEDSGGRARLGIEHIPAEAHGTWVSESRAHAGSVEESRRQRKRWQTSHAARVHRGVTRRHTACMQSPRRRPSPQTRRECPRALQVAFSST